MADQYEIAAPSHYVVHVSPLSWDKWRWRVFAFLTDGTVFMETRHSCESSAQLECEVLRDRGFAERRAR